MNDISENKKVFSYKLKLVRASNQRRLLAWLLDGIIIATFFISIGAVVVYQLQQHVDICRKVLFYWSCFAFVGTWLYYGLLLGFFAQTFGMWFFGLFIVCPTQKEVTYLRAFVWSILLTFLGPLLLISKTLFGHGLHDLLAGVVIAEINGKS